MLNTNGRKGQARGLLLAGVAALTVILLLAMRYFMSDNAAQPEEPVPSAGQLFSGQSEAKPESLRTSQTSVPSGGALDMFSKANAGLYGEEESTAAAVVPAAGAKAPEVRKSTAPAARKPAAKPKPQATVIPRLKPVSFGGVKPNAVSPGGAGQMPDISSMIKQAQEEAGQAGAGGK